MKKMNYEQMGNVSGGSLRSALHCSAQIVGGIGVLGSLAAIGIYTTTPIGWGLFALSAIALIADVAADPTACD